MPTFLDQATFALATHNYGASLAILEVFDARSGEVVLSRQTALKEGVLDPIPAASWRWNSAGRGGEPYLLEDDGQTITLWEKDPAAGAGGPTAPTG